MICITLYASKKYNLLLVYFTCWLLLFDFEDCDHSYLNVFL